MTRNSFASLRNGAGGLCLALLASLAFASAAAAQTGTVTGQVTDGASGRPLESAQVYIEGTALGTLTNSQGRYLFVNAPPGTHTVIAELVGYRSGSETVTVTAGGTSTVDFGLSVTAIQLDQIVVTGTGVATEKKKLGNSIATVDVGALENAPITSFSDVLQGREAGVVGLPGGGDTGSSGRIRIRGSASLSQSNEPIIYLDGVRIDRGSGGGWGAGQAATRRIDDIDPNSIERIEILKGAAAATLYGTEASNGVIQIFTKRGQQGAPRWTIQTDQTAVRAPFNRFINHADFPRNAEEVARMQHRWGVSLQPYEVYEVDYMSELYNTGYGQTYSGSVSGGSDLIQYFASGRYHNENGPFSTLDGVFADGGRLKNEDTIVRRQGTLNLSIFPFDNVRIRVSGLYSELNKSSLAGGNNIFGVFSLGLMGQLRLADDNNRYGSLAFATLRETAERDIFEDVEHFAGSLNANWTIMEGMVFDGTFGVDVTNGTNVSFFPFGWNVDSFTTYNTEGTRSFGDRNHREVTGDFKLSYDNSFTDDITSTLLVGTQGFLSQNVYHGGGGQSFPGPGLEVASAGANQWTSEGWTRVVNAGVYFQEQLGWQDWAFVTLGARFDANSAFGSDFETATYPKLAASVIPTDLFDWDNETLSTFRVRAAWGRSGLQPGAFDKFTTFVPRPAEVGPGLSPGNLGNQALRPEISDEYEFGMEFGLLNDRIAVDLTYWDRVTSDALVNRQFPVTGGFTATQLDNIGQIDATGIEATVNGSVYNSENLSVNVFANTAYIDEIVTDLGGAPPLKTGGSYPRYRNFLKEGYAPGSFFGAVLDPNMAIPLDLNRNCSEPSRAEALEFFSEARNPSSFEVIPVGCAGGAAEYLDSYIGKPTPDFAGSTGFNINFLGSFDLSTNFEYRAGNYHTQDLTGAFRQANAVIGRNVPGTARVASIMQNPASTAEQRLEAALEWAREYRALAPMSGMNQIWTSDFIRLREVSLSYRLPTDMIEGFGLDNAAITLGGRNVHLWMFGDYRGIDPEINPQSNCTGAGVNCNFLTGTEAFGVPIPRRFTFSLRAGF
ncbi:MAG: SusC/RagA family TonB-linked outer membrane protein [Gemmatimonadetes bacterium]|nr:SusC/RagA family TonB-linked outer membrane protein [Gemmatimonadota bacterium]MCY3612755.1 SusC/RagA family TonB-linked outer membrane protein [Gemmatimonadota bacterium]MCY3678502.1 SusC/RagA family TonB-linked outer membrane protein [Gemmatimonadota bacterium]MYA42613.1 SusC/RagA family TonB-linked outer membrane protein [Gemmatimonadota bacterium]MYE95388.1 SusC/RagA family TonB-linked outer membrane protein [Gemmatimonadota bacterium]